MTASWHTYPKARIHHPTVNCSIYCMSQRKSLRWRHNDHAGVSNHQSRDCLLNRLFRRRSKKTSKLRVTGLCAENWPVTGEFPAKRASYAETVSIWWRHHVIVIFLYLMSTLFDKNCTENTDHHWFRKIYNLSQCRLTCLIIFSQGGVVCITILKIWLVDSRAKSGVSCGVS